VSDKSIPAGTAEFLHSIASRRSFLKTAAATAIAGGALAACSDSQAQKSKLSAHDMSGGTNAPNPTPPSPAAAAAAMDAMHEAGIKAFPAKTAGKGNALMAPTRVEKGVKVFEMTASVIQWETAPGTKVEAWTYNEQVPGPQIRVKEGERVRLILHNKLPESTAIHFHGLELPNAM
jgi:FtsP/CotA-like multicopper oxidase with cupredoxin domain